MKKLNIILSIFLFFIAACSKEEKEISIIKETSQEEYYSSNECQNCDEVD